jgi:hypothetical protein
MRRGWTALVVTCAFAMAMPAAASDESVETQLRAMQERLGALEDRLDATTDELESANSRVQEQENLIREAGLAEPRGSSSSLSYFLDTIEVGGWLSVSYWYNFNDMRNDQLVGANTGINGQSNPFNPDANQFSFDQLWFEMERPIDEENRAGFYAEFAYGKSAGLLPDGNASDGGNSLYIPAAYIQYLTQMGPTIKVGKFGTLIGYEVAQTVYNENISRGLVYNMLQPIDHVGILLEGDFGDSGFNWAAGVVNNVFKTQPVVNDNLAYTGKLGYSQEKWGLSVQGIYGQVTGDSCAAAPNGISTEACSALGIPTTGGDSNHKLGIIDVVGTYDPTERLHLWVNGTWAFDDSQRNGGSGTHPSGYGVAVGGRYAVTERLGAALRAEYVADDREYFGFVDEADIWSLTGTVDYAITDQLTLRGEVRYDSGQIDKAPDDLFIDPSWTNPYDEHDQTLVGAELIYQF